MWPKAHINLVFYLYDIAIIALVAPQGIPECWVALTKVAIILFLGSSTDMM